jgi:hypothetical protein
VCVCVFDSVLKRAIVLLFLGEEGRGGGGAKWREQLYIYKRLAFGLVAKSYVGLRYGYCLRPCKSARVLATHCVLSTAPKKRRYVCENNIHSGEEAQVGR